MGSDRLLIVRVDADSNMGAGHLMRCLSLAQGWRESKGEVLFVSACENENLKKRLLDEKFPVMTLSGMYPDPVDKETMAGVLTRRPGAWVALDGYHFDFSYQEMIHKSGCRLLLFDDDARQPFYRAHAILNQNIYAEQLRYSCEPSTLKLLGSHYALLRAEFLTLQGRHRTFSDGARRILIAFGDSDSKNQTLKAIQALQKTSLTDVEAVIVVGANNPHVEELQSAVSDSRISIQLVRNVSHMPELMAWADMAVSAGGSICWELAFMGLPSVLVIVAENQKMAVEALECNGMVKNAGWHEKVTIADLANQIEWLAVDRESRERMSAAGRALIDGFGKKRVVESLLGKIGCENARSFGNGL